MSETRASKSCPFHPTRPPNVAVDDAGVVHVHGFYEAREVLSSGATKQAGLGAEQFKRLGNIKLPVLYLEGDAHREQRTKTAKFFTPAAVAQNYKAVTEALADRLMGELRARGQADLSDLSERLAVGVVAQVVGLTNSLGGGMRGRVEALLKPEPPATGVKARLQSVVAMGRMGRFFLLDVLPAVRARRRRPRDDLISHLLGEGYTNLSVLTECVTYLVAGMSTTREFVCAAAWHLLENPALRARYLGGDEAARHRILHELLRLEPVIGTLARTLEAETTVQSGGQALTLPAGTLVKVQVGSASTDETAVGARPYTLEPERELAPSVQAYGLSFGHGHHRCPGAYLAIYETDAFLRRLLAAETLRVTAPPEFGRSEMLGGYKVRRFRVMV